MQEQIDKLLIRVDYLEKMVNSYQQYLILTWTIIGVVVAIIGVALYFLAKIWVNKIVENELVKVKEQIKNELEKYIDKKPYMRYQMGIMTGAYVQNEFSIGIGTINNNTIGYPNRLELFTTKGNKALKYDADVTMDGKNCRINIRLYNFDTNTDGDLRWVLSEYIRY